MNFLIAPGRGLGRQRRSGHVWTTERGRGEVNLSPKGFGDKGFGEGGLLNHLDAPKGLVGFDWFRLTSVFL